MAIHPYPKRAISWQSQRHYSSSTQIKIKSQILNRYSITTYSKSNKLRSTQPMPTSASPPTTNLNSNKMYQPRPVFPHNCCSSKTISLSSSSTSRPTPTSKKHSYKTWWSCLLIIRACWVAIAPSCRRLIPTTKIKWRDTFWHIPIGKILLNVSRLWGLIPFRGSHRCYRTRDNL